MLGFLIVPGAKRVSKESPSSLNTDDDNKIKELFETPQEESSNVECQILLPTCKRVWAPLNHSAEEGNELTGKFDKSTPPINFVTDEFKMGYGDRVVLRGGGNVWMRGAKQEELVTEELCINQELQSSPVSPPSFDTKGIADDPGSSNDVRCISVPFDISSHSNMQSDFTVHIKAIYSRLSFECYLCAVVMKFLCLPVWLESLYMYCQYIDIDCLHPVKLKYV